MGRAITYGRISYKVFSILPHKNQNSSGESYTCQEHIFGNDQTLYVYLEAWHARDFWRKPFLRYVKRRSSAALIFQFSESLLSENPMLTPRNFNTVVGGVVEDINKFKDQHTVREVVLVGISLSCVTALLLISNGLEVSKLILVVPGDDLAASLWDGIRTQKLREVYNRGFGYSREKLIEKWKKLAPKNNLSNLGSAKILVLLGRGDSVIPFIFGMKLVDTMLKKGYEVKTRIYKYAGHYVSILLFRLFPRLFLG